MDSFFSRYRNALVLTIVLLAQVIGLAVQVRRPGQAPGDKGGVRLIRAWVVGIVSPPERVLHATGRGIRSVWMNYFDLVHVRQQDQRLKAQLDQLRLEEASLAEDAKQGQRLQALLGFEEKYVYKTVAAQVIGSSGTEQSHVLFIDKGSKDGIAPDMAVITPDGIVGKTRDVFGHTSQVLEISDATSGAGVLLQQTRIQGVLRGNSWGQPEMINVSPDDRIKKGEPVVTSGGDSIYPRGLPVGTVDRVSPDPDGTLVNVLIKPAANLAKLEEVLVITSSGSEMPASMQQDLSEAQQRASDILAERLPSRTDPNAPPAGANGQPQTTQAADGPNALPTPPPKPPAPLHPDRYSSSSMLPATDLVPGQRLTVAEGSAGSQSPAVSPNSVPRKTAPESAHHANASAAADGGSASAAKKTVPNAGDADHSGETGAAHPKPKAEPANPEANPASEKPSSPADTPPNPGAPSNSPQGRH
ncbi:MAG TPA: rod shape-determining protein MreC [Acidobacteriaceae bacterium]|nr:rod shape-determining protein MreC [Acidobacteriaceae bacterium]